MKNRDGARAEEVIITNINRRGTGVISSPIRIITEFWDKDGTKLAESDPLLNEFLAVESDLPRFIREHVTAARDSNDVNAELRKENNELKERLAAIGNINIEAGYDRRGKEINRLYRAIKWVLGEEGDFLNTEGGPAKPYWWRNELRQRAGLPCDPGAQQNAEAPDPEITPADQLIETRIEFVKGTFNMQNGALSAVMRPKYGCVELCFQEQMNVPFASIKLYTSDLAVDADAVFDAACRLGDEICRRWNACAKPKPHPTPEDEAHAA